MCVVRDTVDRDNDTKLATFVVNSHIRAHPETQRAAHVAEAEAAFAGADGKDGKDGKTDKQTKGKKTDKSGAPVTSSPPSKGMSSPVSSQKGGKKGKGSKAADKEEKKGSGTAASQSSSSSSSSASSSGFAVAPPEETFSPIRQELLRKYIYHARQRVHPRLADIDHDRIGKLYADLRAESIKSGGLPIAPRHLESIIRMSEAHAKMRLSDWVSEEDVNAAIKVMLDSFIGSQKYSVKQTLSKHFARYLTTKSDAFGLLLHTLQREVRARHSARAQKIFIAAQRKAAAATAAAAGGATSAALAGAAAARGSDVFVDDTAQMNAPIHIATADFESIVRNMPFLLPRLRSLC